MINFDDPNQDPAEDEEGIMIALRYRDHVRCTPFRVCNWKRSSRFRMLPARRSPDQALYSLDTSPKFEAPQLRHIVLYHFAFPIGSPLLASAVGLSTLLL